MNGLDEFPKPHRPDQFCSGCLVTISREHSSATFVQAAPDGGNPVCGRCGAIFKPGQFVWEQSGEVNPIGSD